MHTAIGLNVVMQDQSLIDDDSLLPDGSVLARGEQMTGSPPAKAEVYRPANDAETPSKKRAFLFGLLHLGLIYLMGYFLIASILPSVALVWYVLQRWGVALAIVSVYIAAPLAVIWYATLTILVKRLIIGRVKPGVFPVTSRRYLQYWFLDYLMRTHGSSCCRFTLHYSCRLSFGSWAPGSANTSKYRLLPTLFPTYSKSKMGAFSRTDVSLAVIESIAALSRFAAIRSADVLSSATAHSYRAAQISAATV
jgi:hypothetical protein